MPPKFLGGEVPDVAGKDRRKVLGEWLASPENPFFAKNIVNIVWAHFFGVGIIDPVDDVRVSNPASNPELLDELATSVDRMQQLIEDNKGAPFGKMVFFHSILGRHTFCQLIRVISIHEEWHQDRIVEVLAKNPHVGVSTQAAVA